MQHLSSRLIHFRVCVDARYTSNQISPVKVIPIINLHLISVKQNVLNHSTQFTCALGTRGEKAVVLGIV